jgi:hypothetical protein
MLSGSVVSDPSRHSHEELAVQRKHARRRGGLPVAGVVVTDGSDVTVDITVAEEPD